MHDYNKLLQGVSSIHEFEAVLGGPGGNQDNRKGGQKGFKRFEGFPLYNASILLWGFGAPYSFPLGSSELLQNGRSVRLYVYVNIYIYIDTYMRITIDTHKTRVYKFREFQRTHRTIIY